MTTKQLLLLLAQIVSLALMGVFLYLHKIDWLAVYIFGGLSCQTIIALQKVKEL